MTSLWLVALGGALGAVARAVLSTTIAARWPGPLPMGTIVVNVAGCFVLGLLTGYVASRPHLAPGLRTFGAVGVLGAFTTFSTFENETLALLQGGHVPAALGNVGISLVAGLLAVWVGQALGRLF
ncbi:fluoride efflux transporter CrcB [Luteitalea sp. TBR-22]|uniref:fluoride efflux transporter CrcB n=1 Tax=Luteitalea sp. TBR-22 TaxID=2802971 RepID=UPI001EF5CCB7|nr:fluoride efflux transporter CrcB [Luteitalea sp. TBR-22]